MSEDKTTPWTTNWTDDCQGKKDYDATLVSLSCRTYPNGYGAAGIYGPNDEEIAKEIFHFETQSQAMVAVETWAAVVVPKVLKAVNSHDELLTAAKAAEEALIKAAFHSNPQMIWEAVEEVKTQLQSAIKKAEGE